VIAERRSLRRRTPELLREPEFRRYWGAQTISLFGDQISSIALPLSAVLVLRATLWIAAVGAILGFLWLLPGAVRRFSI
jgi:hypothetical protein